MAKNIADTFIQLISVIMIIGILSLPLIPVITTFSGSIADTAADAAAESNGVVETLWQIISSEQVLSIMFVTAYVVLLFGFLGFIISQAADDLKK